MTFADVSILGPFRPYNAQYNVLRNKTTSLNPIIPKLCKSFIFINLHILWKNQVIWSKIDDFRKMGFEMEIQSQKVKTLCFRPITLMYFFDWAETFRDGSKWLFLPFCKVSVDYLLYLLKNREKNAKFGHVTLWRHLMTSPIFLDVKF